MVRQEFAIIELKAIVFDIDGTLCPLNSWAALTEALGVPADHIQSIYANTALGRIDVSAAKRQVLELWCETGRPSKDDLRRIFDSLPIRAEAYGLVDWLKERGYETCIISGSMDMYVNTVAKKLGVPWSYANTVLVFDEDENLADLDYTFNQSHKKVEQLGEFCSKTNLAPTEIMIVGNGPNDLGLFDCTERGVLIEDAHSESLISRSWRVIRRLEEVKGIVTDVEQMSIELSNGKVFKRTPHAESLRPCQQPHVGSP